MEEIKGIATYENLIIDRLGVVKFKISILAEQIANVLKLQAAVCSGSVSISVKLDKIQLGLGNDYVINNIITDKDGNSKVTFLNNDDDANLENIIKLVNKEFKFKININIKEKDE